MAEPQAQQQIKPRVTVDLPVRVWGMTAEGRPFSQHARAQNVSDKGALLAGVECELKVGDVIAVQYGEKKARVSVIWTVNNGFLIKNNVGVKLLADQDCPWKDYVPTDGSAPVLPSPNRRRFTRHKVGLSIDLRDERVKTPTRTQATDLSGNGCYVETMLPLPVGTVLRIDFHLDSDRRSTSAVIRTCDPGVGNGIEFTGLTPEGKGRLQDYLDKTDPQMSGLSSEAANRG
jgi:hypothetical protein